MQALQVPPTDAMTIAGTDTVFSEVLEHCSAAVPISLNEWQRHPSQTAVEVTTADDITPLFSRVDQLSLIAVHFNDFNDGRGFTIARRLRDTGFRGELRATGDFIVDQLQFLSRCGFDAFQLPEEVDSEQARASLHEFSVVYQQALSAHITLSTT